MNSKKRAVSLKKTGTLKRKHNIPTMSKAIHHKCIDCIGGSAHDIRDCNIGKCPLFPYRFGRNPREEDLAIPEFNWQGNKCKEQPYPGYPIKKNL
ncbi:MAG: hypothetical protein H8D22_01955 [Candidatus Cloacimonetes bacterium]|nr:hypothetical protein [Candidatus Cloacimonadota bacterium]